MNPPTRLEVNLGGVPLDRYDSLNCEPGYTDCGSNVDHRFIPSCNNGITVRQCYQNAFNTYYSQRQVTGVRFQFALCGGFHSTALTNCGGSVQFNTTWLTKLREFFKDIYDSGIRNITPTPAFEGFGGEVGVVGWMSGVPLTYSGTGCPERTVNVQWWPAATYPLKVTDPATGKREPIRENNQLQYNCAPPNNTNFVGWQNIYTVISNLLQAANSNPLCSQYPYCHLNVEEFDLSNEVNLSDFTVQARLIFDNKRNSGNGEDVFGNIRTRMSQNGQDPKRVTFSVTGNNSAEGGCDCGSVYGDSARILHLSALTGGLGGGKIGLPSVGSDTSGSGARCSRLYCAKNPSNPDISDMIGLPISYTQPTIADVHNSPCVLDSQGHCLGSPSQNTQAGEAQLMFTGIDSFLDSFCPSGWRHNSPELCSALFMLGETGLYKPWPSSGSSWNCDQGVPRVVPAATVQGFNDSALSGRTLAGGAAGVVFRPWTNAPEAVSSSAFCYTLPEVLQPTLDPTP